MIRSELLTLLRGHRHCVQASVTADGAPQAAVVGYAVTDDLELVFDSVDTTRKIQNLRAHPKIALVVGFDGPETLQLEGVADEPTGPELERIKRAYFDVFPDGVERLSWPGLTYVRVRLTWARHSDYRPGKGVREIRLIG